VGGRAFGIVLEPTAYNMPMDGSLQKHLALRYFVMYYILYWYKRSNYFSSPTGKCKLVVVDSHIQRIVLATEETTVTQQVSHSPVKC
jgi:hypothetical protein